MSQIPLNNQIQSYQQGTPLYMYPTNTVPQQQTVTVTPQPNITYPYYQYPQTSVYNDPTKQAASGVNIYIYNPSGMGGPSSSSTANTTYTLPPQQLAAPATTSNVSPSPSVSQIAYTPIANTPISNESTVPQNQKTKRIVELTDDYIKSLESYLHSPDETCRKTAIKEIVKRYEEDNTRYDDPALTALLNIALQDPNPSNRMIAMSVVAGGNAHGDDNTIQILNNLTTSNKVYGEESKMASSALLKTSEQTKLVPDYSPDRTHKTVNV